MIKTLEACIRRGAFGPLRPLYGKDARLEAFLPFETIVREGPDEIIDLFTEWWPSEGTLAHWSVTSYENGLELLFERHPVDAERPWTSRHWHEIRLVEGRITQHFVWSDKPRHVGELVPLPEPIEELARGGDRIPLYEGGFSGSRLERIVMPDGTRYILKHIAPLRDVLLRVTNDAGREVTLFTSGVLDRVANVIDYPVLAAAPERDGWAILMRDVSDRLLGDEANVIGTGDRHAILRAVGRLHDAFRGDQVEGVCTVADRLQMLGPHMMAREASEQDALTRWVRGSWEIFFELVPDDVARAVAAIHDDPTELADQLTAAETTLIHGDLWTPNLGLTQEQLILLDWAQASLAPPEMEYAFWVLWNGESMGVTPDTLLDDVHATVGDGVDERTMMLALLGEFVGGAGARGWAWNSVHHADPATRERDKEELDWWVDRAREALDRAWSPS